MSERELIVISPNQFFVGKLRTLSNKYFKSMYVLPVSYDSALPTYISGKSIRSTPIPKIQARSYFASSAKYV